VSRRDEAAMSKPISAFSVFLATVLAAILVFLVLTGFLEWEDMRPIRTLKKPEMAKRQISLLNVAVKNYEATVGSYPPNLDALLVEPANLPLGKWVGPYCDKKPLDPWDHPFQYSTPGVHNPDSFDIWTISPDGQEICNWQLELDDWPRAGSAPPPAAHSQNTTKPPVDVGRPISYK
jgi:general secretion pathway protein G